MLASNVLEIVIQTTTKEKELEPTHSPANNWNVLELLLKYDFYIAGGFRRSRHLEEKPPIGIDLMIAEDYDWTRWIRWNVTAERCKLEYNFMI